MKIDLGCGGVRIDGYTPWDWSTGNDVECLPFEDGSLDEIRASHVLEHISRANMIGVVRHWVAKLKPGGILRIAVPDADRIIGLAIEADKKGEAFDIEGYLLGGGVDSLDQHKTLWNDDKLREVFATVGLVDVTEWRNTEPIDCSDLPISLNLAARKPYAEGTVQEPPNLSDIRGVMTMPRLAWTDTMFCGIKAAKSLQIDIVNSIGVFYGQGMSRVLANACENPSLKYALTIDYDSLFDWKDIVRLREIADKYELDAIAPLQAGRERNSPLHTTCDENGKPRRMVPADLEADWFRVLTMHFGLTLIRLDSLRKLPKPWFASKPNEQGDWDTGKIDDDIWFWKQASGAKWKYGIAPSVTIGHIETVATWVGKDMASMHQSMFHYLRQGKPWYVRDRERWRHEPSIAPTTLASESVTAASQETAWQSEPTHSPPSQT